MDNELSALTTIFTEFYYWMTVVLMFLIHVGFCMYEVGASRYKHHQHTLMKNTLLIPLVTITWFFFGWWIYWAFPTGPGIAPSIMTESTGLVLGGGFGANELANHTNALMAVNLGDHIMEFSGLRSYYFLGKQRLSFLERLSKELQRFHLVYWPLQLGLYSGRLMRLGDGTSMVGCLRF